MSEPRYYRNPETGETVQVVTDEAGRETHTVVRDTAAHERQASHDSHLSFFANKNPDRQSIRRMEAIKAEVIKALSTRVKDAHGPNIKKISDSEFFSLRNDPEFQPLSSYAHKLQRPGGRWLRPILAGEVGMRDGIILILQDGEKFYKSGEVSSTGE